MATMCPGCSRKARKVEVPLCRQCFTRLKPAIRTDLSRTWWAWQTHLNDDTRMRDYFGARRVALAHLQGLVTKVRRPRAARPEPVLEPARRVMRGSW